MADVLHHRAPRNANTRPVEVPNRIFLAAGMGILLIAMLFGLLAATGSAPVTPMTGLMEPYLSFVPFMPLL